MNDTTVTEVGPGGRSPCPHGNNYCYCNYIQVQSLLSLFYKGARTPEETAVCSHFYLLTLYLRVQESELSGLCLSMEKRKPFSTEDWLDAIKRMNRCVELGKILAESGQILRSILINNPKPDVSFALISPDVHQLQLLSTVSALTGRISRRLAGRLRQGGPDPNLDSQKRKWADLAASHRILHRAAVRDAAAAMARMHHLEAPVRVALKAVVPVRRILACSEAVLRKHHPGALREPGHGSDELTFVIAHQAFEVWFPAMITALNRAIGLLRRERPDTLAAAALVRLCGAIFQLFCRMIEIPETMTASDYIRFRAELRGGSGAESIQFRAIEILLGLRDPRYRETIGRMGLLTAELLALWDQPSLAQAVMETIQRRGVFEPGDGEEERARKIAQAIMKPTGTPNPCADLLELTEAAVELEQKRELWQRHHMSMVERMIGGKPSMGVGGTSFNGKAPENLEHPHSLPYLQATTTYRRIFPDLWNARNCLQENWDIPPVQWH